MVPRRTLFTIVCLGLGLSLAGCARPAPAGNALSALDNELVDAAESSDPQANASGASTPGSQPSAGGFAPGDCHTGGRSGHCGAAEMVNAPGCGNRFALGLGWATRLPAGLELYPGAKVIEAAGNDEGGCHVRIVSYVSDAPARELVAWYEGASKAGFETEHRRNGQEDVVAGMRQPQGDAFHVTIAPDAGGSTVDLIVNHGG